MNRPDFPKYPEIEIQTGPPFILYGKKNFRINTRYFAALYIHNTQVQVFDSGWIRWDGRWKSLGETDVLNDLENLIFQVRDDADLGEIQIWESDLREVQQIVKRKAHSGPMPQMDPDIIPVSNGILRWDEARQDFEFVSYAPEIMVFDRMPISYDPAATAPQFEAVVQEILPDPEDRRVAQEYLGAALFFVNRTRKFLLCLGEGGCGKTVLSLFLIKILGNNRVLELNIENVKTSYELAALTSQTLLTAPESVSRALCTEGSEWVKKCVGGDFFQTKQKFRNARVDHYGTFSLIVMSNHQLRFQFDGRGDEWRDRVIPIFFEQHITDERRDLGLVDRLWKISSPGIFNWFLEGAKRVRQNDWQITLSPVQRDRIEHLLAMSHPMIVFVENHVVRSAGDHFASAEAWKYYVKIRSGAGLPSLEESAFYKQFSTAMDEIYQVTGVNSLPGKKRGYRDFKLK
ncbi:MAG: hypothetical protein IKO93_14110 [Lentisphaeria bacterium]|nr:hypothetical protein [Lentisphaeria bacterium]